MHSPEISLEITNIKSDFKYWSSSPPERHKLLQVPSIMTQIFLKKKFLKSIIFYMRFYISRGIWLIQILPTSLSQLALLFVQPTQKLQWYFKYQQHILHDSQLPRFYTVSFQNSTFVHFLMNRGVTNTMWFLWSIKRYRKDIGLKLLTTETQTLDESSENSCVTAVTPATLQSLNTWIMVSHRVKMVIQKQSQAGTELFTLWNILIFSAFNEMKPIMVPSSCFH